MAAITDTATFVAEFFKSFKLTERPIPVIATAKKNLLMWLTYDRISFGIKLTEPIIDATIKPATNQGM